ncbi:MAG: 5-amino-6-(D-ribitylamino)uracil--L-tyrosine 4-hydroxyphenyl transferase CofH [Hyphomicrobiales bacterium]
MLLPKPASSPVRAILDQALAGKDVTREQGTVLFQARGADLEAIVAVADQLRRQVVGDEVTFAVNRNINFTNICYMGCQFCGFAKRMEEEGAEFLSLETIVARAREAWDRGATEVCIQGGLHPKMKGTHYRDILLAIKAELPDMHIHAFSPFEIWYGVKKTGMSIAEFLSDLKACGLGSMPGTAAEILDTEIRKVLTRDKLTAEEWVEIISTAHRVGIPTTATIMYGHVDGPEHWSDHLVRIRDIQAISRDKRADSRDKTSFSRDKQGGHSFRGFTEFVPLSFVHEDAPLYRKDPTAVRPGPTREEVVLMHAVSRIMLHGYIDNIQVSWTKLGPEMARAMLGCGVNDLGGTLMNESISRAAGAKNGQEVTAHEMVQIIRSAGRVPVQRNTLYGTIQRFDNIDPLAQDPLVDRNGADPLAFLEKGERKRA